MLRAEGVDIANYRYAFDVNPNFIPDIGFSALIRLWKSAGLPFWSMMLAIGAINMAALIRISRTYKIDLTLLIVLWFCHLAVVRDFAQLRIGLAISIFLLAICSQGKLGKLLLYMLSASMHYTAVAGIAAFEACSVVAHLRRPAVRMTIIASLVIATLVLGRMIEQLAFLDPRIQLYMKWEQAGYGAAVDSYGILLLHLIVLCLSLVSRAAWSHDPKIRTLFFMQIAGITSFVALSQVAIFAFRISNVILSLYPVLVIKALSLWRPRIVGRPAEPLVVGGALLIFAMILIMRPGSYNIIGRIRL